MRRIVVVVALTLPLFVPAAPRLRDGPSVDSFEAQAYRVLIGPTEVANIEMQITFRVHGKRDAEYTVELYLEVNNTGERAERFRTTMVKPTTAREGNDANAAGEFKLRTRLATEPEIVQEPYLPYPLGDRYWSVLLVLKDGKEIVGSFGPRFVPFVRKDVRVPE